MKKTAVLVKDFGVVKGNRSGATRKLYRLSPALNGFYFVIVSASSVPFSGPETYIFGANEKGEIQEWGGLDGSIRGELNHEMALNNAGYEVES